VLYFVSGIAGNLLSSVFMKDSLSVGASSSLFGVIALEFLYLMENYERLGPQRNNVMAFLLIQIVANFAVPEGSHINVIAHLGGFIGGLLVGIGYLKKPVLVNMELKKMKMIAKVVLVVYFVTWVICIVSFQGLFNEAYAMEEMC